MRFRPCVRGFVRMRVARAMDSAAILPGEVPIPPVLEAPIRSPEGFDPPVPAASTDFGNRRTMARKAPVLLVESRLRRPLTALGDSRTGPELERPPGIRRNRGIRAKPRGPSSSVSAGPDDGRRQAGEG